MKKTKEEPNETFITDNEEMVPISWIYKGWTIQNFRSHKPAVNVNKHNISYTFYDEKIIDQAIKDEQDSIERHKELIDVFLKAKDLMK